MKYILRIISLMAAAFLLPLAVPAPASLAEGKATVYEQARMALEQVGVLIPDEAFDAARQAAEAFAASGYPDEGPAGLAEAAYTLLLFNGSGSYDHDTGEWKPCPKEWYAFDAEVFAVDQMYTLFLRGVAAIVPDAAFSNVREDLTGMTEEVEYNEASGASMDGTRSVSFDCNGKSYQLTLESYCDWFNGRIIAFCNQVLRESGCSGQLYELGNGLDQMVLLFYGSEEKALAVKKLIGAV